MLSESGLETVKLVDKKVIKESSSSVRKMFWIILAFVFLICFFIINAISHLIDYERKEAIGTFRSVGATVEQTVRVFLIENAIFYDKIEITARRQGKARPPKAEHIFHSS